MIESIFKALFIFKLACFVDLTGVKFIDRISFQIFYIYHTFNILASFGTALLYVAYAGVRDTQQVHR